MLKVRLITLNLVYFLNVLLVFLLLFEDKVQLPVFLQVTGRMHTLILHFPLALLFVGIFLEWLLSFKKFQHPATREITNYVFYLFALGAAFTALCGFFLFKEGSYLGEEVILHKWMGTSVSLLAICIVWLKKKPSIAYYSVLGASALCLILAGHLGAEITHGKGFLIEPLRKQWLAENIQIENPDSAIVFRDVIQPIFNEKCLNCHNANRAKNDLILADYQSTMKGGKNKEAIVAGNARKSLMYKYAMLPMDDSLHMPPDGKLQLDREEIRLIGWWINSGAHPDDQYVDLPKVDSIQTIMLSKFQAKKGLDLIDIPFADLDKIKALNNPYRTVQQISATRPYIAVFLGSKKDFSAKDLTELDGIADQIISIDLGNSNVKDEDLKSLTNFTHLQKLHLQNIPVGDDGIKQLSSLSYLDVLNLSGTKVSTKTLDEISSWKNLKKLYLYNTAIPEEKVKSLKKVNPELEVYNTQLDLTDSVYNAQLTMPVCKIDSPFFHTVATIEVNLSRGNVKYYYTLDATDPSSKATLYTAPFQLNESAELRIMATMSGWMDSKVASFPLVKLGVRPFRVTLETKPDPKHSGKLDSTLVDGESGGLNRGDKEFLGYTNQTQQVLFEFNQPEKLSHLTVSFLEDIQNAVFAPGVLEVWGGNDKNKLSRLGKGTTTSPLATRPAAKGVVRIDFPPQYLRFVRVKSKRQAMPSWYPPGKKDKPSVFIDEISVD